MAKCEELIEKAKTDLVKKAVLQLSNIIHGTGITPETGGRSIQLTRGFFESWYNTECPEERLSLVLDCKKLNDIVISIVVWRKSNERMSMEWNNLIETPKTLAEIIASLDGFSEKKPGMWSRSLGAVKSIAQARRLILPVWENTYNALKPFGDAW